MHGSRASEVYNRLTNKLKNMKSKLLLAAVALLLTLFAGFALRGCEVKSLKADLARQTENVSALREGVRTYETSLKEQVGEVLQQRVTIEELRQDKDSALKVADRLGVKVKRLESTTKTVLKTDTPIKAVVRDSLIYVQGKTDTLKCIDYSDKWTTLKGCEQKGVFLGSVSHVERLTLLEYYTPKRFLFIKYGVKNQKFVLVSENPNTKIELLEHKKIVE